MYECVNVRCDTREVTLVCEGRWIRLSGNDPTLLSYLAFTIINVYNIFFIYQNKQLCACMRACVHAVCIWVERSKVKKNMYIYIYKLFTSRFSVISEKVTEKGEEKFQKNGIETK